MPILFFYYILNISTLYNSQTNSIKKIYCPNKPVPRNDTSEKDGTMKEETRRRGINLSK